MRKPLPEEKPETGFSTLVTHRDDKTGLVTHTDPYIRRVIGEVGSNERQTLWERPAGSGNLFNKAGNPIGRWVYEEKIVKGKAVKVGSYVPDAEHIAYVAPLTADQKLRQEMTADKVRMAELERELAQIKAEKEKKSASAPTPKKEQGA